MCRRLPIPIVQITVILGFALDLPAASKAKDAPLPVPRAAVVFESVRDALVMIGHSRAADDELMALSWLGTGFLIDHRCGVATARHLLQGVDRGRLVVRTRNPRSPDRAMTLPARILLEDPDRDLLFLQAGGLPGTDECPLTDVEPVRLGRSQTLEQFTGHPVLLAGFPVLEGNEPRDVPILRQGLIASTELLWDGHAMLLLDLTGMPGFSGAPVILLESGEVIGVAFGPGRTARQYDLNWATPITREDRRRARSRAGG